MSSDSGSSNEEPLSKKLKAKEAEAAVSSKEKIVEPAAEPSKSKKRQAEDPKAKPSKKSKAHRESEATIPQSELPAPPSTDDVHLESCQDVSSSFDLLFLSGSKSVRFEYSFSFNLFDLVFSRIAYCFFLG